MAEIVTETTSTCPNCGTLLLDRYCHHCGQENTGRQVSLGNLFGGIGNYFVDIEHTKGVRTFWALLRRPGYLTNEYLAGHRTDWISPVKLYLTIFALSLFLYSAFKSAAVYDVSTILRGDKTGRIAGSIAKIAGQRGLSSNEFITEVNGRWRSYVSVAQIAYPLIFAFILKLCFFWRRLVEHLVFSLHYQAFALLVTIVAWPLYLRTGVLLTQISAVLALVVVAVMITYLIMAVGRVYQEPRGTTVCKGFVLYVGYYLTFSAVTYGTMALAFFAVMRGW